MLLDFDELLAEANAAYRKAKADQGLHYPKEIYSDQVKCVLQVLVNAINRELLVVHTADSD
jgi:hypothetical protein